MRDEAAVEVRPRLGAVLASAARVLRDAGVEDPGNDARRLATAVLGLSAADMLSRPERRLLPRDVEAVSGSIARRAAREPVSRILGERSFFGRTFAISPATLDPRPDSETLVAAALVLVDAERWRDRPLRILDVGTGSGCLLLSLLAELPYAHGVGTDTSRQALDVARDNARRLGLAERASWLQADALDGIDGQFGILVSNPPYIRTSDIDGLEPEVRCFDPRPALDGGPDGLAFFRRLTSELARVVPDGWVLLEVGHDQADAVTALLAEDLAISKAAIGLYSDLAGRQRCVAGRTRN